MKNYFETIYQFAKIKDITGIKTLLSQGISIDEFKQGSFPLTAAGLYAKEGSFTEAEWLHQLGANISWIACGAASGGNIDYAKKLHATKCVNVTWIAYGAALGGYIKYAEQLRTKYGAAVFHIARAAAQGGHKHYAEKLRIKFGIHINRIANAAALGGHLRWAEYLHTNLNADVKVIAHGAAIGGHFSYVEYLRDKYRASLGDIIAGYSQGGYFNRAIKLFIKNQTHISINRLLCGAGMGGHYQLIEKLRENYLISKNDIDVVVFYASAAGHFNFAKKIQSLNDIDVNTLIKGIAYGGHIQYIEKLVTQYPAATNECAVHLFSKLRNNTSFIATDMWICYILANITDEDYRKAFYEAIKKAILAQINKQHPNFEFNKIFSKVSAINYFQNKYHLDYAQAFSISQENHFKHYSAWFLQGKQLINSIDMFQYEIFIIITSYYTELTVKQTEQLDEKFEYFRLQIRNSNIEKPENTDAKLMQH